MLSQSNSMKGPTSTNNWKKEQGDGTSSKRNWGSRVLGSVAYLTATYAGTVVVTALITSVLAVLYTARHLELLTGRNDLIAVNKRYLQLDEEYADTFHGLEQLMVVAEGPDLEETKAFVRRLGETLGADKEHVQEVWYRLDASSLEGKKLRLLSPADLRSLRENLEEYQDLIRDVTSAPGLNTLLAAIITTDQLCYGVTLGEGTSRTGGF